MEDVADARSGAGGPESLVFIHDAAIDDFVATLLIEAMPDVALKGVVIVNADCIAEPGIEVAARVNAFMGRPDLPLGLSAARGYNAFPWEYRSDCVRLGEIDCLKPYQADLPTPPPDGDALLAQLLEEAIAAGEKLSVLLTTGFTTLTDLLAARPELAQGVGRIAWMGGALDADGNLDPKTVPASIANKHAEWNVFWDPFAADRGLAELPAMAVFPLDITDDSKITAAFMATLEAQAEQWSFSRFAWEAYTLVSDEPFYDMWDVTAALWFDAPQLFAAPETTALRVVQWGFEQGWMQRAECSARPAHDVYLRLAEAQAFYDYLTERLARSA